MICWPGSSWFHLRKNLFYLADGFKMDYGGHDSFFEDNLVMAFGRKACIGFGSFKPGHGDVVRNNKCLVGLETLGNDSELNSPAAVASTPIDPTVHNVMKELDNVAMLEECGDSNALISNNSYFTPNGNASYTCWNMGREVSLADIQNTYKLEQGSTTERLPSVDVMLKWARDLVLEDNLLFARSLE